MFDEFFSENDPPPMSHQVGEKVEYLRPKRDGVPIALEYIALFVESKFRESNLHAVQK
jgi:hypothetical protein